MNSSIISTKAIDRHLTSNLKYLERRKSLLESREKKRKVFSIVVGSLHLIIALCFFIFIRGQSNMTAIFILLVGMGLILTSLMEPERLRALIFDIEREIELLQSEVSQKNISETLFKQHDLQLKRYYDLNLRQNSFVFWVGISCIVLGFGFIGLTMYLISGNILGDPQNKIIVAATGALAGILSNFIGAIYLKMHTNSINSLTEFHNRIVNTHHFYLSNFLISQISDENKRQETLANLALNISNDTSSEGKAK
ncbi:hypothetical protein QJS65_09260 [Bacillus altitudinis]|uniref:TRADD-N-associated membrane domain-containing protein n=1 Tax=Bacillus altitudinis TaxID=293387 RepID=UPI0024A802C5|nr:hypothetical protein [Bacillus altitudinis]WHF28808.1 hypothetical protein QJS65_09260 [Bacillus altitudinis]